MFFYQLLFLALFTFRYLRLYCHIISFWCYRKAPVPNQPSYTPNDVTVIIPTVDPANDDFPECLKQCVGNKPKEIIIVTVHAQMEKLQQMIRSSVPKRDKWTTITAISIDEANKRLQISCAIRCITTKITVLLDDHVFWVSRNFLPTVLAAFEDCTVGGVGTNKRVRRTKHTYMESIWNMLGALYLERHNFEIRATNAIDGGVFVISGRTSAYRTEIINNNEFLDSFTNERFFFGLFGPLNSDDDDYFTRYLVKHHWKIKLQYCQDALIETTLGTYPKFISQCVRWSRTTWRSNSASLFTDRTVWRSQPWCVYAVYITSFVNFALFYDAALIYTFANTPWKAQYGVKYLLAWIFSTKLVKLTPYFLREPQNLIFLPAYFVFAYFHSFIKLYALFTFWDVSWSGRDLAMGKKKEKFVLSGFLAG